MATGLDAARLRGLFSRVLLGRDEHTRLEEMPFNDAGHGYDPFGMNPETVRFWAGVLRPLYELYFRVDSRGVSNIPREGAAILAVNHSGMLPIDAVLVFLDVLRHTDPPRLPRPIGDVFIPLLPVVSTVFSRAGVVSGTRGNVRRLLESDELVLVFPEGVPGISKGFDKRYELQEWRPGHAELAIRYRVPIVPAAVIGAEEAWPLLTKVERFHWFGAPFLPVPMTPFPMPVKIHVRYGPPIRLFDRWQPERAWDPDVSREAAGIVKTAVTKLLTDGLRERKGMFR